MKLKIKKITQRGDKAIVEVEKDKIIHSHTFPIIDIESNPKRDNPLFLEKLKLMYSDKPKKTINKSKINKFLNKEIDLNNITALTPKERFKLSQKKGKKYLNGNQEMIDSKKARAEKLKLEEAEQKQNEEKDGVQTEDKSEVVIYKKH